MKKKTQKTKKHPKKVLVIGGGLSGLSLGSFLKAQGFKIDLLEKDSKLGGMAKDEFIKEANLWACETPHILHFSKDTLEAKLFIEKFVDLVPFNHKVLCLGNGNFSYWPINTTYQRLYKELGGDVENMYGEFVESYSKKMWGDDFESVKDNIKERFKYKEGDSTSFFEGKFSCMPKPSYSRLYKNMSKGLKIRYKSRASYSSLRKGGKLKSYYRVVVTSPIDEFFGYKFGKLKYRGVKSQRLILQNKGENVFPSPVVNFNTHPKVTRATEYNQFYNNRNKNRVLGIESPSQNYSQYPVLDKDNLERLRKYIELAATLHNFRFAGRLGLFKYLNIDEAVQKSLDLGKEINRDFKEDERNLRRSA